METVREILAKQVPGHKVLAFGSRVTWTARQHSDLDLALITIKPLDIMHMSNLREAFMESNLPFSVDIVDWASISESFRRIIEKKYAVVQQKAEEKLRIPSEWCSIPLKDVAKIIMGQSPPSSTYNEIGCGLPFFQGVKDFNYRYPSPRVFCSKPSRVAQPGDILFSVRAPIGRVNIADRKCSTGRGLAIIRPYNKSDTRYIEFLLRNIETSWDAIEGSGSVFGNATKRDLEMLSLLWPCHKQERNAIAHILGTLDDKIELLHRQNKTLEDMAQTLFHKHFVNVFKGGQKEEELRSFINWTTGYSYRSKDLNSSSTALVTLKNFARDGSFRMDGFKEYTGNFKENQVVHQGDLVIAHTDITQQADVVGNPALVVAPRKYKTLVITMDLMKVEAKECLSREFLYYLMRTKNFKQHCLGLANGSTVLHLSREAVPSFRFSLPPEDRIKSFSSTCQNFIAKQFINYSHIDILRHLRDILLPKLVSSELRIASFS